MTTPYTDINVAQYGMLQQTTEKLEELQFLMATPICSTPNRTSFIMSISSLVEHGVKADSVTLKYYEVMENASLLEEHNTVLLILIISFHPIQDKIFSHTSTTITHACP